jgi:hypothetical protein
MTDTQTSVIAVLNRMAVMAMDAPEYANAFEEILQQGLERLAREDCFGTEKQCDPRGDGRNGTWSMSRVEGVDVRTPGGVK